MKKTFLIVLLVLFLSPLAVSAIPLNLDYPEFGKIKLNCDKITPAEEKDGVKCGQDLKNLATWVYSAIVIISGLAAFVMLVWGGITWMSSAGSPTAISDAKDRIQKALLGLLLVLASFLILQVINPELTVLKIPTP
ncbi:MAG: hypothetical protein Greene071421_364 [Parcubacteria group bacterium Greene0714_21]|nr:MAG: hypothetical protein Greene041639_18 [Parcubacteria group bacterium Greene0416_39]TSC98348.1 MAG: hypothetical protein Greene101447_91 [Parcubacteria group bacterium Greene1014_47]TSD03998.1 MAG: hypothetical protein Greene071421_364 [Parcubacteria group bacterium Greene0714_21]